MIGIDINKTVEFLRSNMPHVGDKFEKRNLYTYEELEELKKQGFNSECFDFGIEIVEFTRVF